MIIDPDLERYQLPAELCKVLTDPKPLRLLHALRDGERASWTVGDLATGLGIPLPDASLHLPVLRAAGLEDGRREGTSVRCRLDDAAILDACDIVGGIVDGRLRGRPGSLMGVLAADPAGSLPAPSFAAANVPSGVPATGPTSSAPGFPVTSAH